MEIPTLAEDHAWPGGTIPLLIELTEAMSSAHSVTTALTSLARLALGATGADRCAIFVKNPEDSRLFPTAGDATTGDLDELWRRFISMEPIDLNEYPDLYQSPRTVTLDDVEESTLIPDSWKKEWGSKSLAFSFLNAGGEIYGLIVVDYASHMHAFTAEEAALLDAIANTAGAALRTARLLEQVQHGLEIQRTLFQCCAALRSAESPDRMLDLVADGFMSLLNVARCHIGLVNPDQDRIHSIVWRGRTPEDKLSEIRADALPTEDVDFLRSIWESDPHKPIVIPHLKEMTHWKEVVPLDIDVALLVPLADGDRIIGLIMAGREGFVLFTDEELAVAIAFADQAAAAISRARLNQTLKRRLRVNEALHRLSDLVFATSRLKPLVAQLNETVCGELGFECVRATFADPVLRQLLKLPAPTKADEEVLRKWRSRGRSNGAKSLFERYGDKLAVAVRMDGRVSGVFWVCLPENAQQEELDLVFTIAAGLGEVANKAKLRRTLEARSQELGVAAERERIAQDLHDTVGQTLYGIGLRIEDALCELEDPDSLRTRLDELRALSAQGVSDIRSAVYALSFLQVRARGLVASLRELVKQFTRTTGIVAEFRRTGVLTRLPSDITSALYRVAHEALVNVDRHARASGVVVSLVAQNGSVELSITDDGVGIDQRQAADWRSAAHFGLRTMSRSIEEVGGEFRVQSAVPRGLLIRCVLPLNHQRG